MTTVDTKARNAGYQQAYRARKAAAGGAEVRGIFAPAALHARIKAYAKRVTAKHKAPKG